jgi:predicted outer membrane protein
MVLVPGIALVCLWTPEVNAQEGQGNTSDSTAEHRQTANASPDVGARDFVQHIKELNQAERAMAQMALQQASATAVKAYARQMLDDHAQLENDHAGIENVDNRTDTTGSESGLGVAASPAVGSRMGRTDPTGDPAPGMGSDAYKDFSSLSEKHQVSMNRMKDLSGTRFDREYLSAQITLHRQSIEVFEGQADGAQHPLLKQYAAKRLPVLRKHLQEATRIQKGLAGTRANDGRK